MFVWLFLLITIFRNVHRPCKQPILLTIVNTRSILFSIFVAIFSLITICGNACRPSKHYSNTVNNSLHYVYPFFLSFFLDFLAIFALITIFGNGHRSCKQYLNIVNSCVYSVSSLFPDFLPIFVLITIFGNVHRSCKHYCNIVNNSLHHVYSSIFALCFLILLAIFTLIITFGNACRPCKQLSNITMPFLFFSWFLSYFFNWKFKTCHIWQFLVFSQVTGFQCHSVLVHYRDCSGEITRITKFHGRSEILAVKFHLNGTGICKNDQNPAKNDQNPAGICGASLRPLIFGCLLAEFFQTFLCK